MSREVGIFAFFLHQVYARATEDLQNSIRTFRKVYEESKDKVCVHFIFGFVLKVLCEFIQSPMFFLLKLNMLPDFCDPSRSIRETVKLIFSHWKMRSWEKLYKTQINERNRKRHFLLSFDYNVWRQITLLLIPPEARIPSRTGFSGP